MRGSYLLVIVLPKSTTIQVGKKKMIHFEKGYYGYIGSALNGIEHRIRRHLSSKKKIHWHIDYLLAHAKITQVFVKESTTREECALANTFHEIFDLIPGFGCSDCTCQSHLFYDPAKILMQTVVSLRMKPYLLDANP